MTWGSPVVHGWPFTCSRNLILGSVACWFLQGIFVDTPPCFDVYPDAAFYYYNRIEMMNMSVVFGVAFAIVTNVFLAINKKQRGLPFVQLRRPNRRLSSTSKPLPSTGEKQPSKQSSYDEILPPLRRESLHEVPTNVLSRTGGTSETDADDSVNEETVKQSILPMAVNYQTAAGNLFTPTGFSVDEIKSLGDFPDYAKLSGIPLPDAYPEFDIDKALPRPYRPFRWSYHQTMCKFKPEILRFASEYSSPGA